MKWYFFFLLNSCMIVNAQQMWIPYSIQDSIFKQLELFPQEKIHLHTDRTTYVSGERIWFKAYLVDALTHQSPTYSQYVYVELIHSSDSLVKRVMVSADENGLFHGYIFLSEIIPEGDYTLCAYTRYMENLGDDYFFKKNIRIRNINEAQTLPLVSQRGGNGDDYDVSFFPEGGYIAEGVINRVAFKAINQHGASESITGEIVDNEGNLIVSDIKTFFAGMGSFPLGVIPGKTYFLISKNRAGQEKRFPLPPARKTYSITTLYRGNQFIIQLKKSPDIPQQPLYLLIHCKGEVLYDAPWNYNKGYITLSNNLLPSGVIQILLLDEQMNPISERLIFNKNRNPEKLEFHTDKTTYGKREKVTTTLTLSPSSLEKNGERSHLSISITDNADISIDSLHTITDGLLLSSELRGYIESPGYYLQDHREAAYALDLLMMTHGWRRYALSETVKGRYSHPETGFESAKEIAGSVKTYLFGRPVVNREVMLISNDQSFLQTTTDSDGKFRFQNHYPDSALFFVMANNRIGRENVKIALDPEIFPTVKHAPVSMSLFPVVVEPEKEQTGISFDFITKAGQRAQYDEDIKVINLAEIEITASRIEKRDELRLSTSPYNASSDRTIYREEMEQRMPNRRYIGDYLWLAAGAKVEYDGDKPVQIYLGPMRGSALIYIDGIESTIDVLNDIPGEFVESIDVFKGAGASIFGVRGADGVVNVTTGFSSDNSKDLKINTATITPLGYQKPVEFYSPQYDTPESKNLGNPDYRTTIFWKPDLFLSDEGEASFGFYTSDFPTNYSVVIEGITKEGRIIRQVETIEVGNDY